MSLDAVLDWARLLGEPYTTEDKSHFFYALLKMQKPDRVVELGVGMGVSSFLMAQALQENGRGHLYAVDDGSGWDQFRGWISDKLRTSPRFSPMLEAGLAAAARAGKTGRAEFFPLLQHLAQAIGELQQQITFLDGTIGIEDVGPLQPDELEFLAPALQAPIDVLFADIGHQPANCLAIIKKFLPHMAESSSLFLDSASTLLSSHLALEQTVAQLNQSKVPAFLTAQLDATERSRLIELVATRRFTLMHVTERKMNRGNSIAWIKIEPCNIVPYPLTGIRGLLPDPEKILPERTIDDFFKP